MYLPSLTPPPAYSQILVRNARNAQISLAILRDEHRLLRGFLDSNWKLIEDCECSGRPSTDHMPKEVVNTKFSVKTDEESFQRPMAG